MRFMVLVKASKASEKGELPTTEMLAEMGKFNQELVDAGIMLAGEGLHSSANGVRVHFDGNNMSTVENGPFPYTKEMVCGYWIWKLPSMDEAVAWLKRAPFLDGDEVEIRRIFEAEDFGEQFTPELREQEAQMAKQMASYSN